ncbi:hypothetical protein BGZ61DRAFT_542216 [Ilyonectria robusta]|uniref:uncharacterized protein n=1 Tax=Ilyonectria robusta TaxID=1079257 RepID=UPI001E8DAA78|nr:uncharacterized protein BGZ61DRAFT_542216 [Ilyonectria robusta]KAH8650433.1 hypothetical protein BGZ61DRAFT_542216 [Ilyonectria robusta]
MDSVNDWEPPAGFIEKSKARLSARFEEEFKQGLADRQDLRPAREAHFNLVRNLGKGDQSLKALVKNLSDKSTHCKKNPPGKPPALAAEADIDQADAVQLAPHLTAGPPFSYDWTWKKVTDEATASVSADRLTGNMSFECWSADGGTAAARAAVGNFFRPSSTTTRMSVYANPSTTYNYWSINFLAGSHSYAFVGLYIGEYRLDGSLVRVVLDQKRQQWYTDGGESSGTNSGLGVSATNIPVNSNNFYEVWVWTGGDVEGDGWSTFWGSGAGS